MTSILISKRRKKKKKKKKKKHVARMKEGCLPLLAVQYRPSGRPYQGGTQQ